MTLSEEQTDDNLNLNTPSEIPIKRFNFTLEICLFVVILSSSLTDAAVSNLLLYRTCIHSLNYSHSECQVFNSLDKNNETKHLEKEVQKYTTYVSTVKSIIQSLMPAILSLFLGVWSDTHGRKPLMVWPILGIAMNGMLLVIYSMLNNFGPWWYILTIIPFSITGGYIVLITGSLSYLSDITSIENRAIRMGILGGVFSAGTVAGSLLSSQVLKFVGTVYLLLIGATLNVFAYVVINICLEESLVGAVEGSIGTVLDYLLLKEMAYDCFKKRPNKGRAQILLLAFANSSSVFIMYGLSGLEYLYTRQKVNWILKDYTVYSSVNTTISFFGSFIGFIILQKHFKIGDLVLVTIAFLSAIFEYAIKAVAINTWHMYFGATIGLFKELSAPLIRYFMTKIVPLEDTAKIFALMAAVEGFCPLLAPPFYNAVYEFSITSFPAAIYVLTCGILSIAITFMGIVQYIRWKMSTTNYQRIRSEESVSSLS